MIIITSLECRDLNGNYCAFFTSGGSGGKTNDALLPSCRDAKLVEKKVFKATATKDELAAWMDKF
ncbi:MAG: hypothetical protein J6K32_08590 [Clostridia bacterium]|nr:hypothetical protein [Clostridia bacterium]